MTVDQAGLIDLWNAIEEDPHFDHLRTPGIRLVPGTGSDEPFAMVVGEAPGATENHAGKPFVGASGQVLQQLMAIADMYAYPAWSHGSEDHPDTIGQIEPNVWLTNTVKYRPLGNRTPSALEEMAATPYLRREWALIGKPRLIVAVGSVAARALGIMPIPNRGDIFPFSRGERTVWFCCQYHPAFGMRGNDARKEMIEQQWETMGEHIQDMIRQGDL